MDQINITSFEQFHKVMEGFLNDRQWIFRGQNSVSWELVPKLGRPEYAKLDYTSFLSSFKRRAIEFITFNPENDWDWLMVGQHHGLPTMLLDWTFNPLVAAFFAVAPVQDADCAIYAYRPPVSTIDTQTTTPDKFKGVSRVYPRGYCRSNWTPRKRFYISQPSESRAQ